MAKYVEFTVSGIGRFPVDMLRYDGAYPASSSDAGEMAKRIENTVAMPDRKPIRLRAAIPTGFRKNALPTVQRWNSFCWRVDEIKYS
jgi:hypothetical protein